MADAKLKAEDSIQGLKLANIHGAEVEIPDPKSKWIHLQFRRFAGCPICNLHLQSFVKRDAEIKSAGIHEVVVFHSSKDALLPFQGKFPFDVIGDPEKKLYRRFGVESSILSILNPLSWPAMIRGMTLKEKPAGAPQGGASRPARGFFDLHRREGRREPLRQARR